MHCIAALSIDGFYVSALRDELPVDATCVVVTREKLVLDASSPARAKGISVGQTMGEARAILGKDGSFFEWKEGRFSQAAETWLNLVAEYTGIIEPDSEHRTLLDLSGHPDILKIADKLRAEIEAKFKVSVAMGIGGTRWIAEASCSHDPLTLSPLLTPRRFIQPFSTLRLEPVEWKDRERLMALGYRTIGQVAEISLTTLGELFGKRAFGIAQAAQGLGNPRITPEYPKASRAEFFCFETPPENWMEIEMAAKRLAQTLGSTLTREDLAAYDVEVVATAEDATRTVYHRSFTSPLKTAKGIERVLMTMLKTPLEQPLERLLVRLNKLEKAKRLQQTLEGIVRGGDRSQAMEIALKNLKATFGAQAIEKPAEMPVARFQEVRRAWQEANGWVWR